MNDISFQSDMSDRGVVYNPTEKRHIWEVSSSYRCPVIGTCLNAEEHKRILKKAGYRIKGLRLHKVHSVIMGYLHERNKVSLKVEHYLNAKYRGLLEKFGEASEEAFRGEWQKRIEQGGFDGLFYLACIRRDLSEELVDEMFGDIHMMSHLGVNTIAEVKGEIIDQKQAIQNLDQKLKQQKQVNRELTKENESLKKALAAATKELEKRQEQPQRITSFEQSHFEEESKRKQKELGLIQEQNRILDSKLNRMTREADTLAEQLNDSKALNEHLQKDIEELMLHFSQLEEVQSNMDNDSGLRQALNSKRVLIVGGMTKIRHLYQHMIEANGGQFEYHDGSMKNGKQKLDAKVSRSDIIICPVNCNSHNACNRVKKLCLKHNKPLKILSNASVSSISTALFEQKAEMNAQFL